MIIKPSDMDRKTTSLDRDPKNRLQIYHIQFCNHFKVLVLFHPKISPLGDGFTKSSTATFAPYLLASLAVANPPDPPIIVERQIMQMKERSS